MKLLLLALACIAGDAITTAIGWRLGLADHNPLPLPLLLGGHLLPVALLVGTYRLDRTVAAWCSLIIAAWFAWLTLANTSTLLIFALRWGVSSHG